MNFKKIIACVAALSICLTGFGQSIDRGLISDIVSAEISTEVEGLRYKVLDNGTIEILLSSVEDEIVIPETIDGKKVTSIGQDAFWGCRGITSITIPDSVTSIGDRAFWYCIGLTSITIPDSVTSIGHSAFYGCRGITSITIPDSVTSIGKATFYDCEGLTSITIPDSVTSIGDVAFGECRGLTIHGYENSYAQTYAKENDIPFEVISSVPDTPDDKDAVTGDIDNNGVVSTSDLLSLIRYIIMNEDSINKLAADLNKDGEVNILDAIALKKILMS